MLKIPQSKEQLKEELDKQSMIDNHKIRKQKLTMNISFGFAVRIVAAGTVLYLSISLMRRFLESQQPFTFVYIVLSILLLISIPAITSPQAWAIVSGWTIARKDSIKGG